MYQLYANNSLIFESGVYDLKIFSAALDLEMGKTGALEFTIYPEHPSFDEVFPMAPVRVSRFYSTIYSGRVLSVKYGFYGEKQVTCEGGLAFLLDSYIQPHVYSGDFSGYLDYIVRTHNAKVDEDKRFIAGNVTVADYTPFRVVEKDYRSAFDVLNSRMVSPSGGYLSIRYEGGYQYLDLLSADADASNVSGQSIELGKNLLDISREQDGTDMFSCIIPLGAKLEDSEKRLTIEGVNGGVPYLVTAAAVEKCRGKIYRQVVFDNITNAETLKSTAEYYLNNHYAGDYTIEVTAADLSGQDAGIDFFRVGQWVRVYNQLHFGYAPQLFLIKKITIDLMRPEENKIVIGKVKKGFAEEMADVSDSVSAISVPEAVQPYVMESGTTGIWTWKKFSDNTCEFFGKIPITSADVSSALGGWYRGSNLYDATAYEYPVLMTEAPAIEMTFQTRNGMGAFVWIYSADAETAQRYLPQCYLIRPTTATGIHGNINIIGKGKLQ